ncbi:hypothetical protein A6769_22030 [Nostoc punctiforme NIES-2108]|uniref:Uncharacterized protein n=1 Tax=Nostoc punctiforme NIES-2108 TaxID=1356359 RepID=A0A367RFK8_NOSPU|nr:hypothetical protein A6769_22030 [Nostoc punctiforme NIES-2108]
MAIAFTEGLGYRSVAGKAENYLIPLRSTASAIALRSISSNALDLGFLSNPDAASRYLSGLLACQSLGMLVSRSLGVGHWVFVEGILDASFLLGAIALNQAAVKST